MKPSRLIPIASVVLATGALSADPAWWTTRGVKTASPASNLSPATIGQAKHIAAMALAELENRLSPADHLALVSELSAIVDFSEPLTQTEYDSQREILLSGQLKAMARPIYDKLRSVDPDWLDGQMDESDILVTEPASNPPSLSPYPWSETSLDDSNKSPATLGQLKAAFSLRFETLPAYQATLSIQALDALVSEDGQNNGLIRISRSTVGNYPLTVSCHFAGTAVHGWDYTLSPASPSIPAGESHVDVVITGKKDHLGEPEETIVITLLETAHHIPSPGGMSASLALQDVEAFDDDGLDLAQELALGTSPVLADTDGDGVNDSLDAFPLDPDRWNAPSVTQGDTTAPLVSLLTPATATFVSGP
jgi:hypothetical protein